MNESILFEEVKNKLNITWEDIDTNNKIKMIIKDAIATLNYKLGADVNYLENGLEHQLFLNYCLYSYNNALHEFDKNYMNDIYQLRIKYEVQQYENKQL